jgi:GNAT superfamily N-acetyltransferase
MSGTVTVRRLSAREAVEAIPTLAEVLIDCVDGGASVSFMPPMTVEKATRFWRLVADGVARDERALIVAEDESGRLVGTVQLVLAMPENQPHRAELAKMLVHRRARRQGVAERLLHAAESTARDEGRTLLVLDAVTGGDAARLYARNGWQRVGDIPAFALMPDGSPCSTTYFYKVLEMRAPAPTRLASSVASSLVALIGAGAVLRAP